MMNVAVNKKKGKLSGAFEINAWSDEPALPDISPADAGKVLVIDAEGNIVAGSVQSKLYMHDLYLNGGAGYYGHCILYTYDSTPFTLESLAAYLYARNYNGASTGNSLYVTWPNSNVPATFSNNVVTFMQYIKATNNTEVKYRRVKLTLTIEDGVIKFNKSENISDYTLSALTDFVSEV